MRIYKSEKAAETAAMRISKKTPALALPVKIVSRQVPHGAAHLLAIWQLLKQGAGVGR